MAKRPEASEADIQERIRAALAASGWTVVDKTHGNCFQPGWPDLYAYHPCRGPRWIEVKRPSGTLTKAQVLRFSCWTGAGIEIHVLCDTDFAILFRPGNWTEWLSEKQLAYFKLRREQLCPAGPRMTRLEDWA